MRKLLLFLGFCALLSTAALALDTGAVERALPESASEILGDISITDAAEGGVFQGLLDWGREHLREALSEASKSAGAVLSVALLCSAGAAISGDGKAPGYILAGGALAIFGLCAGGLRSFLGQVTSSLGDLSDFSKALLPCVTAASAAAGKAASASARYGISALFLDILMGVGTGFVLPAIHAYAAVSVVDAALPEGAMSGPAALIEWCAKTLLTALTTVFTLALAISGIVAGSADKLVGSAAKTVVGVLPVVGSILSDATDAYLAGAQLLRGSVGVFGLAVVLAVCAGPALRLGAHYILFKAAACVAKPFADGRLAALIGRIASAFGMALGLLGSAGAMLFISVSIGMGVLSG